MTHNEIDVMRRWPGTYNYICQLAGHPVYTHTHQGQVLYKVTDEDRLAQAEHVNDPPRKYWEPMY